SSSFAVPLPSASSPTRRSSDLRFPYDFVLTSTFRLEGKTVCHTLTVENPASAAEPLPFGIGYHPAFNVPFDDAHTLADYEFRFEDRKSTRLNSSHVSISYAVSC